MISPLPLQLIAEATTGGSVSEDFVVRLIPAIIAAIFAGVFGHKLGKKQVQVKPPFPKVTVDHEVELVSKDELRIELLRIEKALDDIRGDMDEERNVARTANGKIHARIDKVSEGLSELIGNLGSLDKNVSRLLDIALSRGGRRQTGG